MTADLLALRRVPARFFGVFMSVNPVFAALTGVIVLGQSLPPADWLAITAIVAANAASIGEPRRGPGRPRPARRARMGGGRRVPVTGQEALRDPAAVRAGR
jgi:inner membrane transporter RhtA